ncbi:TY-Chap domain-containing protein [Nocardia sp. NPDC101769]|uniref:TY-Chap domain-containing protein n=1 Tax=Nocardia sp. NPDC101769 TaxID=3364333 RepID=UPI0037F356B9
MLEELPQYLYPYPPGEHEGALLQIRDVETGYRVLFCDTGGVEVMVALPDDPEARQRLVDILRTHRTTNVGTLILPTGEVIRADHRPMWGPSSVFEDAGDTAVCQVSTAWTVADTFREEVAAALVEIFRDGWGACPQRLRYSVSNFAGPEDALHCLSQKLTAVAPDRPTHRNAGQTPTSWDDFAERLEWAINTLPYGGILSLHAPNTDPEYTIVEFANQFRIHNVTLVGPATPRDRTQLRQQMGELGWEWEPIEGGGEEYPMWNSEPVRTWSDFRLRGLVPRTVTTLRDVFDVADPRDLTFTAEAQTDDPTLAYLDAELGLTRRPR